MQLVGDRGLPAIRTRGLTNDHMGRGRRGASAAGRVTIELYRATSSCCSGLPAAQVTLLQPILGGSIRRSGGGGMFRDQESHAPR